MSTDRSVTPDPARRPNRGRVALLSLTTLLCAEAALMLVLSGWFLLELVSATPASFADALAIFAILLVATVFVVAIAVGALKRRPWIRGGAVTWQFVQIAVAVGCFQGAFAAPGIGWLLLIPSVLTLVLLFTPPVIEATRRDPA